MRRQYDDWKAKKNQLPCVSVWSFSHLTIISYSYNCSQGLLTYCQSAISSYLLVFSQIQALEQHIKYFEKLQLQCKFDQPLRFPLHSNI